MWSHGAVCERTESESIQKKCIKKHGGQRSKQFGYFSEGSSKVNTTKNIKMVSITSIETKLVQKKKKAKNNCTGHGSEIWEASVTVLPRPT